MQQGGEERRTFCDPTLFTLCIKKFTKNGNSLLTINGQPATIQNSFTGHLHRHSRWFPKSKRAAAVYLYQADNDGEWGEIRFDFVNGTTEIVRLAEWDTVKSNIFARTAIRHIQSLPEARLPSEAGVMFDQAL